MNLEKTADLILHDNIKDIANINNSSIVYRIVKRVFDIFCALIGCIFLIPIMLILKIAYILTGDFHSIFLPPQNRIGQNGRIFKFYKFRSMVPNSDAILFKMLAEDEELAKEYKINKKIENDPRVTKVGKIIRKLSIDELPQLFNILKGDMSVIGNRPYLEREIEDMGDYYNDIVKTKPGLTGFWQCSLRSRGTFEDRLKMEKYYSNHHSLKFDIKIFFKTIIAVIRKDGAK